jgi:hypothetical protein
MINHEDSSGSFSSFSLPSTMKMIGCTEHLWSSFFAFRFAGIDVQFVKRIKVTGKPGDLHRVRVVEHENPAVGYSWEASNYPLTR